MKLLRDGQKGSVSLFIVIFAALLIITIGTAFIIIMIQGQGQATSDDLSRSALDSANAGVEDAKRAIVQYNSQCLGGSNVAPCPSLRSALFPSTPGVIDGWSDCPTTVTAKVEKLTGGEVQVGKDSTLNQAYTCVKVEMNTPDYVGTLVPGVSRFIPLKAVGGAFDTVAIEWFSQANLQAAGRDTDGNYYPISFNKDVANPTSLPPLANWPASGQKLTMPSLMRSQLLQYNGNGFQLADFAKSASSVTNANAATMFLYPSQIASTISDGSAGRPATPFALYDNSTSSIPLQTVSCKPNFTTSSTDTYDGYACKAVLQLPLPIGATALSDRVAYLRLMAPYNASTDFRVTMLNSTDTNADVNFAGVQPIVDSTGRANTLFRRVKDRVEASGNGLPYPEAALTVGHDVCKSFSVSATDYKPDTGCTP
jgi:hypothetical protein